ncbi:MAG: peptidylprolyl isomerase [Cryobacterium sp.]|nr:peptidylprolyl isomerase [Oligoflexia bacterium]
MSEVIGSGKVVGMSYRLTDDKGVLLDQASHDEPFLYIQGASQIVPGLEKALEGVKIGEKKKVSVDAEEGYGPLHDGLKMTVKKDQFPGIEEIQPGMQFQAQSPEGHGMVFTITDVKGDDVTIDGNHPLAGQTLHFAVEILSIREATEEEMSHGHVHGEGGHHH